MTEATTGQSPWEQARQSSRPHEKDIWDKVSTRKWPWKAPTSQPVCLRSFSQLKMLSLLCQDAYQWEPQLCTSCGGIPAGSLNMRARHGVCRARALYKWELSRALPLDTTLRSYNQLSLSAWQRGSAELLENAARFAGTEKLSGQDKENRKDFDSLSMNSRAKNNLIWVYSLQLSHLARRLESEYEKFSPRVS